MTKLSIITIVIILLSLSSVKAHDEFTTNELRSIATDLSNYQLCTNDRNLLQQKVEIQEDKTFIYKLSSIGLTVLLVLAIIF
jgi:hypothetical protein